MYRHRAQFSSCVTLILFASFWILHIGATAVMPICKFPLYVRMPILLFIIDGLGDRPISSLDGKTPLDAATTPNLNKLASQSQLGLIQVCDHPKDEYTSSESGHFSLFGYSRQDFPGRGVLEALGLEIPIKENALYFRANFATFINGLILDRRAGRISESTSPLSQAITLKDGEYQFNVYSGVQHRAVLEIIGSHLSPKISSNDSKNENASPLDVKPEEDSDDAKNTSKILNHYLNQIPQILSDHPLNRAREVRGLSKANYLLVRGASAGAKIQSFDEKYHLKAAAVAGGKLYRGVATYLGMTLLPVVGATGDYQTDLQAKFEAVSYALKNYDFVFLHIKALDELGHDGKCLEKKEFIEKIDRFLPSLGSLENVVVAITSDHATPCELKTHTSDSVPLMILGSKKPLINQRFTEKDCQNGSLGLIRGLDLMPLLLKLSEG